MIGREDELGEEKTRRCVRVTESIEGNGGRDEGGDDALITPTTAPTRHSRPAVMTNEDPAVEVVFTAMTPFYRCIFPLRLLFRRMALRRPNFAVYPVDDFHPPWAATDHHYRFCAVPSFVDLVGAPFRVVLGGGPPCVVPFARSLIIRRAGLLVDCVDVHLTPVVVANLFLRGHCRWGKT
jgi:hypothetical protein